MKFCFYDKNEEEFNIVTSILDLEQVKYTHVRKEIEELAWTGVVCSYKYDIYIDTFYEYYLYLKEKVEKGLTMINSYKNTTTKHEQLSTYEAIPITVEGEILSFTIQDKEEK